MSDDSDGLSWIDIDYNRLDKEWLSQTKLYMRYAEQLAEARFDLAEANNALEVLLAEEDHNVRKHPEEYDVEKITEKVVENAVLVLPNVKKAKQKLNELKRNLDLLQACINGLEQRKKTLEHLVQLRLADYFSEPRGPKGVGREEVTTALGPKQGRKERR